MEHVKCLKAAPDDPDYDEKKPKVLFDFLGKDSIRYLNEVAVSPQVGDLETVLCFTICDKRLYM